MTIERRNYDAAPRVSRMLWDPERTGIKTTGTRLGFRDAFLWIDDENVMDLTTKLLDHIEEYDLINSTTNTNA